MEDPRPQRQRRPRVEGKRSKQGCGTCISKKVKCDENEPNCGRCVRLRLDCVWPSPKPKLSVRRRGFGPVKDRAGDTWKPPDLLPSKGSENPGLEVALKVSLNEADVSGEEADCNELLISPPPADLMEDFLLEDSNDDGWMITGFNDEINSSTLLRDWEPESSIPPDFARSISPTISLNLSSFPFASAGILDLRADDNEALVYFRTTFSQLKSTRSHSWSAHAVFLYQASCKRTALHFLLAVSHNELALHCGVPSNDSSLPVSAREHYEKGSQLLLQRMTENSSPDCIGDLLSFLYMYMFWMRRDQVHPQRLRQISQGVLNYVKGQGVISNCVAGSYAILSSNLSGNSTTDDGKSNGAMVARLLTYLYDRDVYCSFFGCGGQFANYLDLDPERRQEVWAISRTLLLQYWGQDYPRDEFIRDIEQARIYDMYFSLITICHSINRLSQDQQIREETEEILRRRFDTLQVEHSLIFHLIQIDEPLRPNMPLLAYVSITFFHALQIYLLRATSQGFGGSSCLIVQNALKALINTAHLAMTVGPVQLLERFQWALLIAGIETDDVVHRDWIFSSISDPGIGALLGTILRKKKELGGVITVTAIRQIVSGEV